MRSLAAGTTITPAFDISTDFSNNVPDGYIKSIVVHLETPAPTGFTPSAANTISTSDKPVYIVFDNANDADIMHFYTKGDRIVLSSDSSFMFYTLMRLAEISGISDWDTSSVNGMLSMFYGAGNSASTWSVIIPQTNGNNISNTTSRLYGETTSIYCTPPSGRSFTLVQP